MSAREVIARALWLHAAPEINAERALAALRTASDATRLALARELIGPHREAVPLKPTEAMDEAFCDAIAMEVAVIGEGIEIADGAARRVFAAMLAAASEDQR